MRFDRARAALAFVACGVLLCIAVNETSGPRLGAGPEGAPPPPEERPSIEPTRRGDEGPDARRAYELRKLVDPATGELPAEIFRREQLFARTLPVQDNPQYRADKSGNLTGWTYRGPHNVGGRTRALALDVSDAGNQTFLAGGVSGGMWRTTNEGTNWTMVTGSTQLHSVTTVAQDTRPGHQNVWYYGTGEYRGNSAGGGGGASYRGDGVFKSTDSGLTWSLLPVTGNGNPETFNDIWQYVHRIAVDPTNLVQDEVYAATFGQIHRSLDGGNTWTAVLGTYSPWSAYTDVVVSPTGVVYASLSTGGGQAGIFRSPDGITWTNITPASLTSQGRIVLSLAPSNENIMYAFVADYNGTTAEGFFRYDYISGNGSGAGGAWQDRSANLSGLPGGYYGSYTVETYGSYCQYVAVNPTNPNIVYLGGVELTRSLDGFATNANTTWIGGWTYTNQHADQHWMFFLPGSSTVAYTGSDGGVHKTLDANASTVSWISMNNGYNTSQFYTVALDEFTTGDNVIMGGTQDNGTNWYNGIAPTGTWIEQWGGDGSFCSVVNTSWPVAEYYFSSQYGRIYYEGLDAAGNWYDWTRLDPTGAGNYLFINPFILDPVDDNTMWLATDGGVWRNDDLRDLRATNPYSNSTQTLHWTHVTTVPAGDPVTALAMTRAGGRTLYYGTANGGLFRVDNAHLAAASTTPTALTAPVAGGYVSSIAIDPTDDMNILLCFSNYNVQSLWRSTDGGLTWTDIEANLAGPDGPSVRAVRIVRRAGYQIWFAGTSVGLYSKLDVDPDWAREADNLIGTVVVDAITSRHADGVVGVGTHGRGVYSIQIPTGVVPVEIVTLEGAQRGATGVTVNWRASAALFGHDVYVYREGRGGDRILLTESPLRGDARSFTDTAAPAGETSYHLKLVSPEGGEVWYGPITVAGAGAGSVFSFSAPSPNPFRTESTLAFNLPRSGNVKIQIYTVRGQLVRTLRNEMFGEGPQQAVWDGRTDHGRRAAGGVYYAKISYDGQVRTQKMLLVK